MRELLWLTPLEALAVFIATTGMYLALVVFVRLLGQRVISGMSAFDLAAVIAFGSVIGRAALGESPVLGGGLVALVTLIVLQGLIGTLRHPRWGYRMVTVPPVLLMAGSTVIKEHMERCHVMPQELQARLRSAGIRHPREVAAVTFESSGGISVLRRGEPIDPLLLSGVIGASLVPADLLAHPGPEDIQTLP